MSFPPAPISPYVITVKYTPAVTGCHNVCFKLLSFTPNEGPVVGPDPDYCCYQDTVITPLTVGIEQTIVLDAGSLIPCPNPGTPITVAAALGAGTYIYDGYVQPCCAIGAALQTAWINPATFVVLAL